MICDLRCLICNLRYRAAASIVAAVAGSAALAAWHQAPAPPVPVVVELFTSEGCSSCPPADALLIALIKEQPVKGAFIIGLSEHVDYWDRLGWKDPFSDATFTRRQTAYSAAAGTNDVYTPQMIVDGTDVFIGSDRAAAVAAIGRAATKPKPAMRLEWAAGAAPVLSIVLQVENDAQSAGADVWLAITEDDLRSSVRRGENAGRELAHVAVTRRLTRIGKTDARGGTTLSVPVRVESSWNRRALRAIVFVQPLGVRRVVAAGALKLPD